MDDSEDKTGPQKHSDTATPAQNQSTTIVPPPNQSGSDENQHRPSQQEPQNQPPREERVLYLQIPHSVTQDIWNGIVAVFTIFLSIVTYWQYQLGKEQNELGRDTLRFTQMNERPWVSTELLMPNPLLFDEKGNLGIEMTLSVKNVGKAVAQETWIWRELVFLDPDGGDIAAQKRQREVCRTHRNSTDQLENTPGFVLFPEVEALKFGLKMGKWAKDIATERARALPASKGKVGFAVIGCVSYRAESEDRSHWRHQTRFLYHLGLWDDETETFDLFMKPRGGPYNIILLPQTYANSAD